MSESEYEDDAAKLVALPIASTSTIRAVPVLPEPIRLLSLMAPVPHITEPRGLGEMDVAAPRGDMGPSEEMRTLQAELAIAQVEIAQLKRSLEVQAEREREADKDGDVQIPEPAADMPTRIAKIEEMVMHLASVGDGEICEHRTAVHEMLGQLAAGIDALRIRVGLELPSTSSTGNNNKRCL
ncbi:hypothetical protein BDV93DRAFT_170219 [Ceratobasidium sp. AG-I]|nr:hypothetical protein BDV93DRAFT_170219 [Ceratobasidium sp. AG-I]